MRHVWTLSLAVTLAASGHAHSLWIEPSGDGYKALYGEAAAAEIESGEKLAAFKDLVATEAAGTTLGATLRADHLWIASRSKTLALVSLGGILSTSAGRPGAKYVQYARFVRPGEAAGGAGLFLDIVPVAGEPRVFELRKDGQVLGGAPVELHSPSGWQRGLKSGSDGRLRIQAPWKGRYVLTAYWSEKKVGEQDGKKFETLGHMASASFIIDEVQE